MWTLFLLWARWSEHRSCSWLYKFMSNQLLQWAKNQNISPLAPVDSLNLNVCNWRRKYEKHRKSAKLPWCRNIKLSFWSLSFVFLSCFLFSSFLFWSFSIFCLFVFLSCFLFFFSFFVFLNFLSFCLFVFLSFCLDITLITPSPRQSQFWKEI